MKVSVLGCGRWGSFLAWYMNRLNHDVISFGPDDAIYRALAQTRKNEYITLPEQIQLTNNLQHAVTASEIIIISISSQALRGFLKEVTRFNLTDKKIVLCMKGIEEGSGKRLSEVAIESGIDKQQIAVWVGPGHIQDFVHNIPNCMVIDAYNPALTRTLAESFRSDIIRFYFGSDIIGTEIGAAAKNIFGIIAGVLDGMGYASLKGPLMARGAWEVARLIKALGGNELSAYGLCHLGDYETTLFSPHSHNRMFGEMLAKGKRFEKLAEGVSTARAVSGLAQRLGVNMPITETVNTSVCGTMDFQCVLKLLFGRDMREEFT
ncbi:MAG: NAD(P)H-dependent glycerol-3-phosphate dehydrogenase [Firmicutes bacterium]|nr:NAD(P)H-dependent glycerol-3-phosphate dehydrogenase [Bacillota bacterium]